jgi:hypothetical protein
MCLKRHLTLTLHAPLSVQGVTGFGSAILNLCTWIVFVVARVGSGATRNLWHVLPATTLAPAQHISSCL